LRVQKWDLSKHKGIELKPLSDLHLGQDKARPEKLEEIVRWIKDEPNRYTLLNGDLCEIALRDSYGDIYEQRMSPQQQSDEVVRIFKPIKNRILGVTTGNHEERIRQRTGIDIAMVYASALEAPYDPASMILALQIDDSSLRQPARTIYFSHGWSSARTIGPRLAMPALLQNVVGNCDMYITAHTHQYVHFPQDIFNVSVQSATVSRSTQHFVGLGSLLDHAAYAERTGRRPTTLMFPTIELRPTVHRKQRGSNGNEQAIVVRSD